MHQGEYPRDEYYVLLLVSSVPLFERRIRTLHNRRIESSLLSPLMESEAPYGSASLISMDFLHSVCVLVNCFLHTYFVCAVQALENCTPSVRY
jgi:hypothetical protein